MAQDIDSWIAAPKKGNHKCTFVVQYNDNRSEVTTSFNTSDIKSLPTTMNLC
jgi:hypothetical protein